MIEPCADDTFYPSPRLALAAPAEGLAYVSVANPTLRGAPDLLAVVDVNPRSASYGTVIGQVDMPHPGDHLQGFAWNACSSSLCPGASRGPRERRYLVLPGLRSSRIHVVDTRPDPRHPRIVKVIAPDAVARITGYARPLATHSSPEGVLVSALGAAGTTGPGGIFVIDPETFELRGPWEIDRGPQRLGGDFAWHLGHDVLVTGEWAEPAALDEGLNPARLRRGGYGHRIHIWDSRRRVHLHALDLGPDQQGVVAVRPAHSPTRAYGFAGVLVSAVDWSAAVWLWHRQGDNGTASWAVRKIIDIPAEPAPAEHLPPVLAGAGVVPPLVTAINLSLDDRLLYVSCWGTGELRQYDVSQPLAPRLTAVARLGGITRRTPHPAAPATPLHGGPHGVEISRDGRRVYVTNAFHDAWDAQLHGHGLRGWLARFDVDAGGGLSADPRFFLSFDDWRPHQVRLEGGDASSDTFCYA